MPRGVWNAHAFQFLNSVSWQVTLGAPTILFAKSLGATSTMLGLLTALMPLLVILQIPAAKYLPKYGYRRFTLMGWGLRTLTIFVLAAIPLLGAYAGLAAAAQLAGVFGLLFLFNVCRGVASGAWGPWMSAIIPGELRGTFLARDNLLGNLGSLVSLLVASALLVGTTPGAWQFSLVFLMSALAGAASLHFIRRIPDVTAPETLQSSGHPVPWRHMLAWPPFARLLGFNLFWVAVTGGLGTFTVAFLRGSAGYTDAQTLRLAAFALVGSVLSIVLLGRRSDATGSKPLLVGCGATLLITLLGWALVAAGTLPPSLYLFAGLNLLTGASAGMFNVANSRLTMSTFPLLGRNHFFALFSVTTSLTLGLSPIVWGALLDVLHAVHVSPGGLPFEFNRYSLYFLAVAALAGLATLSATLLLDPFGPKSKNASAEAGPALPPFTTSTKL